MNGTPRLTSCGLVLAQLIAWGAHMVLKVIEAPETQSCTHRRAAATVHHGWDGIFLERAIKPLQSSSRWDT